VLHHAVAAGVAIPFPPARSVIANAPHRRRLPLSRVCSSARGSVRSRSTVQVSRGVCTTEPMSEASKLPRAEKMLAQAAKINCNKLITASQVVAGNPRLNLAFVANVFNTSPGE
jgi:hypothetical protein